MKKENWGTIGKPKDFDFGYGLLGPGTQLARIIYPKVKGKRGIISSVRFYTEWAGKTQPPLRLRIYALTHDGMPAKDLLLANYVTTLPKGQGWVDFYIEEEGIVLGDSMVVAAEYFDTDNKYWRKETMQYKDSTGNVIKTESVEKYGGYFSANKNKKDLSFWRVFGQWERICRFNHRLNRYPPCGEVVAQVWVKYPN